MNKPRWCVLSWARFVAEMLEQGDITLTISARRDVATRRWIELTWTAGDDTSHTVSGSSMDIVLRRASEVEDKAEQEWEEEKQ